MSFRKAFLKNFVFSFFFRRLWLVLGSSCYFLLEIKHFRCSFGSQLSGGFRPRTKRSGGGGGGGEGGLFCAACSAGRFPSLGNFVFFQLKIRGERPRTLGL